MNREDIVGRLVRVMEEVFDADDLKYDDRLAMGDFQEWDNLSHARFLSAVEKEFSFQFTSGEVDDCNSAGDVVNAIVLRSSPV